MLYYDDVLVPNSTISEESFYDMIEFVLSTMEQFTLDYPDTITKSNYNEVFKTNIKCMFDIQYFPDISPKSTEYEQAIEIYDDVFDILYSIVLVSFMQHAFQEDHMIAHLFELSRM